MTRLIDVLSLQYSDQERLYISWDAAGWRDSQQLRDFIIEVNEPDCRPKLKTTEIVLAPLPAKTSHLNVIASVFSGMANPVIHNSNYVSVQECTDTVDRYFSRRNAHFKANPQHAGNKNWGKEQ